MRRQERVRFRHLDAGAETGETGSRVEVDLAEVLGGDEPLRDEEGVERGGRGEVGGSV